jgi:hypothetical protein
VKVDASRKIKAALKGRMDQRDLRKNHHWKLLCPDRAPEGAPILVVVQGRP